MPTSERLFFALKPDEPTLRKLIDCQAFLKEGIGPPARWSPPDHLHLTLHFMRDVEPKTRDQLLEKLRATTPPPGGTQPLDTPLAFPTPARATVAGLGRNPAEPWLLAVHAWLGEAIEAAGIPTEARDYHPHVTFARFREPRRLHLPKLPAVAFPATAVTLFRSQLGPHGSRYEIVGELPLPPATARVTPSP